MAVCQIKQERSSVDYGANVDNIYLKLLRCNTYTYITLRVVTDSGVPLTVCHMKAIKLLTSSIFLGLLSCCFLLSRHKFRAFFSTRAFQTCAQAHTDKRGRLSPRLLLGNRYTFASVGVAFVSFFFGGWGWGKGQGKVSAG